MDMNAEYKLKIMYIWDTLRQTKRLNNNDTESPKYNTHCIFKKVINKSPGTMATKSICTSLYLIIRILTQIRTFYASSYFRGYNWKSRTGHKLVSLNIMSKNAVLWTFCIIFHVLREFCILLYFQLQSSISFATLIIVILLTSWLQS